jgi:hypothetical protein
VAVLAFLDAAVEPAGRHIRVRWQGADPGGYASWAKDAAKSATSFSSSKSLRAASDTNVNGSPQVGWFNDAGTLTVTLQIEVATSNKRLYVGEALSLELPAGFVKSNAGGHTCGATGVVAVETDRIGVVPLTDIYSGSAGNCKLWLEAGASQSAHSQGTGNLSSWLDRSGRANHAAAVAGQEPTFTASVNTNSRTGGARARLTFNGTSDRMGVPDHASLATADPLTLAWAGWIDSAQAQYLVSKQDSAGTNKEWWLRTDAAGIVYFGVSANGSVGSEVALGAALSVGAYHVILIRKDGVDVEACIDGEWFDDVAPAALVFNGTAPITIGAKDPTTTTEMHAGRTGEVVFYTVALSEAQAASLLNQMADRWGVTLHGAELDEELPTVARRGRTAVINCYGANFDNDPQTGQATWWYDDGSLTVEYLQAQLQAQIDDVIDIDDGCDIGFRLPGGVLRLDIMLSAGPSYMTANQRTALSNVLDDPANNFGDGTGGTRIPWLYTGFGMPYDFETDTYGIGAAGSREGGRMNHYPMAPTRPQEWLDEIYALWQAINTKLKFFFLDAATIRVEKALELLHDAAFVATGAVGVCEAFTTDETQRLQGGFCCIAANGNAPWFIDNDIEEGYDADWEFDEDLTRGYFLFFDSANYIDTSADGVVTGGSGLAWSNMTVDQIRTFMQKGGLPVAQGSQAIAKMREAALTEASGWVPVGDGWELMA